MGSYKVGVLEGEKKTALREFELRKPEGNQVLVKVDCCAICTLEQRIYLGVMKRYPFAGGHEMAGTIEAAGEKVKYLKPGDKVAMRMLTSCGECYYCRSGHENQCVTGFQTSTHEGLIGPGGFSEYMLVDSRSVYRMAPDIDLTHAALTEPLACCVHSINTADIKFGNDVVVVGVGIMGAFHIQLAKLRGARVIACEMDEERIEIARKMGADVVVNSKKEKAVERVRELTDNRGADAVFCTVAAAEAAEQSVAMAGKLGKVVFYSSIHPDNPIALSANKVHGEETIITGSVNPNPSDFLAATRLLSYKFINPALLISEVVPLSELDRAFRRAVEPSTYRIVVKCS